MSYVDRLYASIEERLTAVSEEIAALESARAALGRAESPRDGGGGVTKLTRPRGRRTARERAGSRSRRSAGPAGPELAANVEQLLRESPVGLSAVTVAKRLGAGYAPVLAALRALEQSGQVRRSGERRTSLWRLVSEEELIAERAAELERLARG